MTGFALFWDVGCGKTRQSLKMAKDSKKLLVIAPKAIHKQWLDEAKQVGVKIDKITTIQGAANLQITRDWTVICDEASLIKNRDTCNWRTLKRLADQASNTILLTATPFELSMRDAYNLMEVVAPNRMTPKEWAEYYQYHPDEFWEVYKDVTDFYTIPTEEWPKFYVYRGDTRAKVAKLREITSKSKQTLIFTFYAERAKYLHSLIPQSRYYTSKHRDQEALELFKKGELKVLIATDALAYGISFPLADTIVNFDMHSNPARIYQRIGRIWRRAFGNQVDKRVYFFVDERDMGRWLKFLDRSRYMVFKFIYELL